MFRLIVHAVVVMTPRESCNGKADVSFNPSQADGCKHSSLSALSEIQVPTIIPSLIQLTVGDNSHKACMIITREVE